MSQPFYATTFNLGGTVLSTSGGFLLVGGSPVAGVGGSSGPLPSGEFQTNRIDLRKTGIYPLVTGIPAGFFYLINSVECVLTNNTVVSGALPQFALGTGNSDLLAASSLFSGVELLLSPTGRVGDRFIWDIPLSAISGNAYLSIPVSGHVGTLLSGVFLVRGDFVSYAT